MAGRRKPRGLRPDEAALWQKVAGTATPLNPGKPAPAPEQPKPAPAAPRAAETAPPPRIEPFEMGSGGKDRPKSRTHLAPSIEHELSRAPVAMDRKAYTRMRRGKMEVDARIDLHGMTLDQAHDRLRGFVLSAQARGLRLVLVITGKGKDRDDPGPIPRRRGALRHQVPDWLRQPPLSFAVLQVTPAHRSHGGLGAYYVYLRRFR